MTTVSGIQIVRYKNRIGAIASEEYWVRAIREINFWGMMGCVEVKIMDGW
jgi:hypothetical protein